jgi:hypothetical protein
MAKNKLTKIITLPMVLFGLSVGLLLVGFSTNSMYLIVGGVACISL